MISVIIPLYNKEKTILSTLNSIRNQTLRNWECIVVDDGSSDNSCKIIEELHDERIRLIKKRKWWSFVCQKLWITICQR